jgi:leader peptidase (prepilin peptidase)/N-methyltransferase
MLVSQGLDAALFGVLGLLIGSFLNVVIHRLPIMLEAQWRAECAELNPIPSASAPTEPFNLLLPRSRCPQCAHAIRWYENIPVLSYLVLKGRCSACQNPISLRYPLVELASAALFSLCAWRWGIGATALLWSAFSASLLSLALIDWDTTLLPDVLTLPLLWAGLTVAALQWTPVSLPSAFWGAVAGYLSLWSVYWVFKLVTGKEGMGYGDFKLLAALGAWFGWQALVPIVLMSSVIGAVIGIGMKFTSGLREGGVIPFGPFLAGAGLCIMLFGADAPARLVGF